MNEGGYQLWFGTELFYATSEVRGAEMQEGLGKAVLLHLCLFPLHTWQDCGYKQFPHCTVGDLM